MKKWIFLILAAVLLTLPVQGASSQPSGWAAEAVQTAVTAGLVPEALQGDYDAPITRSEFCTLAASLYGVWEEQGLVKTQTPRTISFTDCDEEAVLLCASLGVVNGVGNNRFNPDAPIRRQDAAAMLHRLAALQTTYEDTPAMPHVFYDGADLRSWARSHVYWVYENGIMQGTGGNYFRPDGSYTREQSILTMLRLYDSQYAVPPQPPEAPAYTLVMDDPDPDARKMHLEDRHGNRILTDLYDSNGFFTTVGIYGPWLSVEWNDYNSMAVCAPETGVVLEGYYVSDYEASTGVGWIGLYAEPNTWTVIHEDGTTGGTYTGVSSWYQGRSLVWSTPTTLTCIDQNETVLWSREAPGQQGSVSTLGLGDRVLLRSDTGCYLLLDGAWLQLPTSSYPDLPQWNTNYVYQHKGSYTLRDWSGNILAGPYDKELREVGQDLYCRQINDTQYEYFRCTAGGTPQVLFTADTVYYFPVEPVYDGGGVYALRTGDHTILCFDRFGDTLGTIETDIPLDDDASICFESGCILVVRISESADRPYQSAYYLPTGELVG